MILKIEDVYSGGWSNGYMWWDGIRRLEHCERKIDPRSEGESVGMKFCHVLGNDPNKLPEPLPEGYDGITYLILVADLDNGERHAWYIESGREVYLLNNEGKTIERL